MSQNNNIIISNYIKSLKSANSRLAYIRDLKQFQKWLKENSSDENERDDLFAISKPKCLEYKDYLLNTFSRATSERKLSAVKGLYKKSLENNDIAENPFDKILLPPKAKKISNHEKASLRPLDEGEVEKILLYPDLKVEEGHRDYILILIMFSLGLKVGEVVNLHRNDFKIKDGITYIRIRKGQNKSYISKVSKEVTSAINQYLKRFKIQNFLFMSLAKNHEKIAEKASSLTPRSGWVIVKKYLKKARMDHSGRTTNCAREFFINVMIQEDQNLNSVRKYMGLQSENALRRYIDDYSSQEDPAKANKTHPVDLIKINIREY